MIKQAVGRLFGFQGEIEHLQQQIRTLSWDEPFAMWTRPAFTQASRQLSPAERWVIFIDLNEIGELNLKLGYTEVDRRIRKTFAVLKPFSVIIARWYSGDEIVILCDSAANAQQIIERLQASATSHRLTFMYTAGAWDNRQSSIEERVSHLAEVVSLKKQTANKPSHTTRRPA